MNKTNTAQQYFNANPNASTRDVSKILGISKRTVRRARQGLREEWKATKGNILPEAPSILMADIETCMIEAYIWALYKQRIQPHQIKKEWSILSWSAKWLYAPNIMSDVVTPTEAINREDKRIMTSLYDLLNQADIIVAHNLVKFDIRKINSRLLFNGFPPPLPYQMIDTLTQSRKLFAHTSHTQDYLTKTYGLNTKLPTDYQLWIDCMHGDQEALDKMVEYNRGDIKGLEDYFSLILPWMRGIPNAGLYMDTDETVCVKPGCGNTELTWEGYYYATVNKYRAFRCDRCGGIGRSRVPETSKDKRKGLIVPVAR